MVNFKSREFSAPIMLSARRICIATISFIILGVATWRFSMVIGFNYWFIVALGLGMLFYSVVPIYLERKEYRIEAYTDHLKTISIPKLEEYARQSDHKLEKELIETALYERLYLD